MALLTRMVSLLLMLQNGFYTLCLANSLSVKNRCPQQCSCDGTSLITIYCGFYADESFQLLSHVPKNIPTGTVFLSLYNNIITEISKQNFRNLTSLKNLNLRSNRLTALPEKAFRDLSKLKSLNLGANKLSILPDNAFEGLESLEELFLDSNNLRVIPNTLFKGLTSLRRLYLHKNMLTVFPQKALHGVINLKGFWLNNNLLTRVEKGTFKNLTDLAILYLSNNILASLDYNVFHGISALKLLSVSHNNLSTLPQGIFDVLPQDSKVSLDNNPFVCDCKLHWIKRWITSRRLIYNRNQIRCRKPVALTGRSITTVRDDQFTCSAGEWGSWSNWSPCSKTCGNGTIISVRTCVTTVEGKGRAECPGKSIKWQSCVVQGCGTDGAWTQWNSWSECSKTCSNGIRFRTRSCTNPAPQFGGKNCKGDHHETKKCHLADCIIKRKWTTWSSWTDCSSTCAVGKRTRTRTCLDDINCKGNSSEISLCYLGSCPINGNWSEWSTWTSCSVSCSRGTRSRVRSCSNPSPNYGGSGCEGNSSESSICRVRPCPVHGGWSAWSDWTNCSTTCSYGQKSRNRTCTNPTPEHGGRNCSEAALEKMVCVNKPCEVQRVWSQWSEWISCSKSCGNGTQKRTRVCVGDQNKTLSSQKCHGQHESVRPCFLLPCPVDGGWSSWSSWSTCIDPCTNGTRKRYRKCSNPTPKDGGKDCFGLAQEIQSCFVEDICVGIWSGWSDWTKCNVSCSKGFRYRSRNCTSKHASKNILCVGSSTDIEECNAGDCAVAGAWSEWSAWTSCSASCSNGTKSRNRTCTSVENNCAGQRTETVPCFVRNCTYDLQWSAWSKWSECRGTCGYGKRTRTRNCTQDFVVVNSILCIGNATQVTPCKMTSCPVEVEYNLWSPWSKCSVSCGLGKQVRFRNCSQNTRTRGNEICKDPEQEARVCYTRACAKPLGWSAWSNWTACSVTCGNGIKVRSRICHNPTKRNVCRGQNLMVKNCKAPDCDHLRSRQVSWLPWTQWSTCSASCGRGHQMRWRFCYSPRDKSNATKCSPKAPFEVHSRICNATPCNYSSVWTTWTKWKGCNRGCGIGMRKRVRYCLSQAVGIKCKGKAVEIAPCNSSICSTPIPLTYPPFIKLGSPIPCPDPGTPRNGERKFIDQIQFGSYFVSYSCNKHFYLVGAKLRHCERNNKWSDSLPKCVPLCGKSSNTVAHRRLRIVGGGATLPGAWPWQVALEFDTFQPGFNTFHCGGTLVAEQWLVTAAHCVVYKDSHIPYHGVRVYVGVHDITKRHWDSNVQIISSAEIIAHPKFNWKTYDSDIALVRLRWRVNITNFVRPACLPNSYQRRLVRPGTKGVMLGWGVTETKKPAAKLREAFIPVVNHKSCKKSYENETWPVTSNMLCAGLKVQSKDSCNRDSGGGFIFYDKRTRKKKWFIGGVISWGNPKCGVPGKYSVFTRITHAYVKWIKNQMKKFSYNDT